MGLALAVAAFAVKLYCLVLIGRLVVELVMMFARTWRPRGWVAVPIGIGYAITDPPVRLARRLIPPLRLGGVSLDVAFAVVLLASSLLASVLDSFALRFGRVG